MDNPKKQVVDRIKQAANILVTVSTSPTVDQLSAVIGLTLLVNKMGKHGTAVFSGEVPSTIEFLEPEKTIEETTDSLRDFVIALDRSKADKLRYKVEDNVVKIFITPYRTSITEKDLNFSQGDFNVDVVVALGVKQQNELDQAITNHGRILHDATVISVNNGQGGDLGNIHWQDAGASSLSEMIASLSNDLGKDLLDGQIATALLTGIVAETNRFSNNKTTSTTMSLSSQLMAAGANQQLVATKLQESSKEPDNPRISANEKRPEASKAQQVEKKEKAEAELPTITQPKKDDGTLQISHDNNNDQDIKTQELSQIHVDDEGTLSQVDNDRTNKQVDQPEASPVAESTRSKQTNSMPGIVTNPPSLGGTFTANSRPQDLVEPSTDALSLPTVDTPFLSRSADSGIVASTPATSPPAPVPLTPSMPSNGSDSTLDKARGAVQAAISANPDANSTPLPPIDALNARPVFDDLNANPALDAQPPQTQMSPVDSSLSDTMSMPMPSNSYSTYAVPSEPQLPPTSIPDTAPPPVPPPMTPMPPPQQT